MQIEFENYLTSKKLSNNSIKSYISDLKQYMKYYEDSYGEKLVKLNDCDVQMYISYLKNREERKAATINRALTSLKAYNQFLIEKGLQDSCVISDRDYIKVQANYARNDIPEEKQIIQLLHSASKNPRDYCILVLASYGGFRESEIVGFKISHIHLKERFIEVFGKGNKYRTVVINDIMYKALEKYLEQRLELNISSTYLFVGKKSNFYGDKPLNRNLVNRILDNYCTKLNFENFHPHLLRGFFCTNAYYKAGYTLIQVSSQAGHSSVDMTRRYIDSRQNNLYELSNKM